MPPTAKLVVVLKADDVVVAEIENPVLWQRVLAFANADAPSSDLLPANGTPSFEGKDSLQADFSGDDAIGRFARTLGISTDELIGAMSPSREPPYLTLDRHCWAAMKKGTPLRGPGSLSHAAVAGTLLALWVNEGKLDVTATQTLATNILNAINVQEKNPSRSIKNTKWLQGRPSGVIVINPAEILKAQAIAKAFCTKAWPLADN